MNMMVAFLFGWSATLALFHSVEDKTFSISISYWLMHMSWEMLQLYLFTYNEKKNCMHIVLKN